MMSLRLGKLMIFVSDLEIAKYFYSEILGFPLRSESGNRLEFEHEGDVDLIAFKCREDSPIENYSQTARSVFVFEVASLERAIQELQAKSVHFLHDTPAENEFSRYAAFSDPFGNVHEIFERK